MTVDQWIPVDQAFPPQDERVVIATPDSWQVGRLHLTQWQMVCGYGWTAIDDVTHWLRPSTPECDANK